MEDDRLKTLFDNFRPELSPDEHFMEQLQRSMASVEIVREKNAEFLRRNRRATLAAAVAGFAAGTALTTMLPLATQIIKELLLAFPIEGLTPLLVQHSFIPFFLIASTISVLTALNTYEAALSLLERKTS